MGLRQLRHGLVVISAFSVLVSACGSSAETTTTLGVEASPTSTTSTTVTGDLSGRIPVIVDYSPTVSDVGGLMYLLVGSLDRVG